MNKEITLKVKEILNGYLLTLESGNVVFCENLDAVIQRIKTEIEVET